MKALRLVIIAATLHLIPSFSFADANSPAVPTEFVSLSPEQIEKGVETLLAFPDRPTTSDILNTFGGRLEKNPFLSFGRIETSVNETTTKLIPEYIPAQIAGIERAFPNARFAPLGRDAAPYADYLDAFYISIGQTDRLARLNGSGGTIRGASPTNLLKMMESAGFDLSKGPNQRPFLLMDATTYTSKGSRSQTGHFMNAVYAEYKAKGGDPSSLVRTLNVVGLRSSETKELSERHDFEEFFAAAKRSVNENAVGNSFENLPRQIFGLQNTVEFTYNGEWHQGYGPAALQPNGKFEGSIGNPNHASTRLTILANMYAAFEEVSKPSFREAVRSEAKKFGYNFFPPVKTPALITTPKSEPRLKAVDLELHEHILKLSREDDVASLISPNGHQLSQWLKDSEARLNGYVDPQRVSAMKHRAIKEAKVQRKISASDFKLLIPRTCSQILSPKTRVTGVAL